MLSGPSAYCFTPRFPTVHRTAKMGGRHCLPWCFSVYAQPTISHLAQPVNHMLKWECVLECVSRICSRMCSRTCSRVTWWTCDERVPECVPKCVSRVWGDPIYRHCNVLQAVVLPSTAAPRILSHRVPWTSKACSTCPMRTSAPIPSTTWTPRKHVIVKGIRLTDLGKHRKTQWDRFYRWLRQWMEKI